jgi:hypothetical protein
MDLYGLAFPHHYFLSHYPSSAVACMPQSEWRSLVLFPITDTKGVSLASVAAAAQRRQRHQFPMQRSCRKPYQLIFSHAPASKQVTYLSTHNLAEKTFSRGLRIFLYDAFTSHPCIHARQQAEQFQACWGLLLSFLLTCRIWTGPGRARPSSLASCCRRRPFPPLFYPNPCNSGTSMNLKV